MYVLDFFPYPSGEGLSVGHARNYVPTDVLSRYYRMRGYDVLHPMGWDAFGLPAENEALMKGRHPRETTREYAANYRRQLRLLGCSYDWTREINTSDPAYYRWTQWTFLILLRQGLAFRAPGWQWWCPQCGTILANEQVVNGRCWRHDETPVERRRLEQWYVRTTAYAERLLADLDPLDWPEPIKAMQRNWIGRSEGVEVRFRVRSRGGTNTGRDIETFTTRVDTVFGVTFLALAPEHADIAEIVTPDRKDAVARYVDAALRRTEVDRKAEGGALTGAFTGAYAEHPLTGQPLPIFVADYVLAQYATAAVMGVPAHDRRDFAFAAAVGLPVRRVVDASRASALPYPGEGVLIDSGTFTGLSSEVARERIADALERVGRGRRAVRYRMRDWLISRQRYWGAPIPIVYCNRCGIVPVPEEELPVLLPDVDRYASSGTGRSPLASISEFVSTSCPRCQLPAARETDTLDGFADSNWYFLRFADPTYDNGPWNREAVRAWLPVDWYVGGAEHAVMHLLYARFFTKVAHDAGLLDFTEPFVHLRNQGSMLSPVDGSRMSKSRGNVITPDEVIADHGADTLRVYELFIGPFHQDVMWDRAGIAGASRFVRRLYGIVTRALAPEDEPATTKQKTPAPGKEALDEELRVRARLNRLIGDAGEMIEAFRFNILVAQFMALLNELEEIEGRWRGTLLWREVIEILVRLIAPITPFLAEEAWHGMGRAGSVHLASWPRYDAALARPQTITLVIQVNGKVRDRIQAPAGVDADEARRIALGSSKVRRFVDGKQVAEVIVVPGRLVNVVVK